MDLATARPLGAAQRAQRAKSETGCAGGERRDGVRGRRSGRSRSGRAPPTPRSVETRSRRPLGAAQRAQRTEHPTSCQLLPQVGRWGGRDGPRGGQNTRRAVSSSPKLAAGEGATGPRRTEHRTSCQLLPQAGRQERRGRPRADRTPDELSAPPPSWPPGAPRTPQGGQNTGRAVSSSPKLAARSAAEPQGGQNTGRAVSSSPKLAAGEGATGPGRTEHRTSCQLLPQVGRGARRRAGGERWDGGESEGGQGPIKPGPDSADESIM